MTAYATPLPPNSPVRVGFVIDTLEPGAGTENQLILLLERFDRRRVEPRLCCIWDNPRLRSLDLGCPVEVLGFHRLVSAEGMRGFRRLRQWIHRERLQIVSTFFRDGNFIGTLGAWSVNVPVVSNRRNLGRGYWHNRRQLWTLRRLNRVTDWFVANSMAVKRYTVEAEGVDPDRIAVIHNAVDTKKFRPARAGERAQLRHQLGMTGAELLIGCVANLRPIKSVDTLIRAFAASVEAAANAHQSSGNPRNTTLALVGSGSEEAGLRHLVADHGLTERVRFLGQRHDAAELMRCFDIAVLPSRSESFSNSVLEYMASGLPVIATEVGDNVELLGAGVRGLVVPPNRPDAMASAILGLAAHEHRREQLGSEARAYVERHYEPETIIELWQQLFEARTRGPIQ